MNNTIKLKLLNLLPFKSKWWIEKLKLFFKAPKLVLLSSNKLNKTNKTIVLISFPRSGSSWVGSIIGFGDNTRYLREPVTTPYMLDKAGRISVFYPEKNKNNSQYYAFINRALNGNPPKLNSIYKYPNQWINSKTSKTLVIKEVNPLVTEKFLPNVSHCIYLVRHPYSVAISYNALNWQSYDMFTHRFETAEISLIKDNCPALFQTSFWFQIGYLQGWIEAKTKLAMNSKNVVIIRYEDFCQKPTEKFEKLFDEVSLPFTEEIQNKIHQSFSEDSQAGVGEYTLQRNQTDVAYVKVKSNHKKHYVELMNAYHQAINDHNINYQSNSVCGYQLDCSLIKWID